MRSEESIKTGLKQAEEMAEESINELIIAFKNKDWPVVFEKSSTINLISITITAINDSVFGEGLNLGD